MINDDNDVKIIESSTNCSFDAFTKERDIIEDFKYGGSNDSEGKCYITNTSIMFELKIPFYSGDDLGHDLYTVIDDEFLIHISITIYFTVDAEEKAGGNYKMPSGNTCKFIICNSTVVPVAFSSVMIGIITIAGIIILKKNRKKKIRKV